MTRVKKGKEFHGNIVAIRSIEDCIRATKKYTEGMRLKNTNKKNQLIQGNDFPSRVFCKYYEVYPDMEVGLDMDVLDFADFVWGALKRIDVMFHYDYRSNKATLSIEEGDGAINKLIKSLPGFGEALKGVNGIKEQIKS